MSDFAVAQGLLIGQYLPGDSWLHRLDPRVKLVTGLGWVMAAIIGKGLLGMALGLAAVVLAAGIAGLPLRTMWQGMRRSLPVLVLLAALQVFVSPGGAALLEWWRLTITVGGLASAALMLLRFALLIWVISALSLTTRTNDLVHGMADLLGPLQRIGLPVHELSLMFDITLRFVPMLATEAERLAKAQASRGGDWGGAGGGLLKRVRRVAPLIVPLFLAALQRAERLTLAMEARGYAGGQGRTRTVRYRMQRMDWAALVAHMGLLTMVIIL